ncbi:MAG TPA: hypothetical protein VNN25_06080 [Thermoanaerobaculia bacterium]|nr:hypothetical protein [Thermoanaerobaculia bacterium]
MSNQREIAATTTEAADAPPADGSMPDIAAVMALIGQIEAQIPGFTPHDSNHAKRVANMTRFAKDLIPQMIATVSSLPSVVGMSTFDVAAGKTSLAFDTAMQPVIQALSALLDGAQFTTKSRLARSTGQALATFAWMKKTAKGPDGVALRPHVDDMALTMKKALNRRSKPASKPPVQEAAQDSSAPNPDQGNATVSDDDLPDDSPAALEKTVKE